MKELVYICSPLRGDVLENQQRARGFCKLALQARYIPIAPHIYFTQFLNDDSPEERAQGIEAGLELLKLCRKMWVFLPPGGEPSQGMKQEIELAKSHDIEVTYMA